MNGLFRVSKNFKDGSIEACVNPLEHICYSFSHV